jgi:predicted lactoylglutathione lyase
MRACLSFISLGVADVASSRRFYESLGLVASERSGETFAFFQLNGVVLAITSRSLMLREAGLKGGRAKPGPVCLSHNVRSPEEVDAVLRMAVKAGAKVVKPAAPASWGGRCGWFEDPDGHLWEIVHNPRMAMDAAGNVFLEPPGVW